jgi:aminoglycoside phosphotransferase family enzyme/predicted kinase
VPTFRQTPAFSIHVCKCLAEEPQAGAPIASPHVVADLVLTARAEQADVIRSLVDPAVYGPSCTDVHLIETHISYVLLTGAYAYKIKKAVNLGFLDFTTLAARRYYCQRELELNKRLAPAVYLDVVSITGTPAAPRIDGDGPVLEYAVKMRQFPQDGLLTRVLARGALTAAHVDTLASIVAAFHSAAAVAPVDSRFGSADDILALAIENFTEMDPLVEDPADRGALAALRRWTEHEHASRAALFAERRERGFVRECHGDLHLGNIALIDGAVTLFDCIEFNDDMRWSDVMADVAFLVMDLRDRGRPDFASRFLNAYLELTGDYDGVQVLRFYVVYRAMVRAKVAALTARQAADAGMRRAQTAECSEYLTLARRCADSASRGIVITHGVTGSGKTTRSLALIERAGAIRIRTDVERKRQHGLGPQARTGSPLNAGLYSALETDRTYANVLRLARTVVSAGFPVVVDGTFLQRRHRDQVRALASELEVPLVIVDFVAPVDILRARVQQRHEAGVDASDAEVHVLEHQLQTAEPLTPDERGLTVTCDAGAPLDRALDVKAWRPVLDRLQGRVLSAAR